MSLSIFARNGILDATLNGSSWTVSSRYVALFTTVPTETTSGTELPYSAGYARVGADVWTVASGGLIANNGVIRFGTATDTWGTIYGFGIFDQGSAGNRIYQGSLTNASAVTINSGDQFSFAAGDLIATFTNSCS